MGKRQKNNAGQAVSVTLAADFSSSITPQPAFALFPQAQPSAATPFRLYSRDGTPGGTTLLAAENADIEYESRHQPGSYTEDRTNVESVQKEETGLSAQYLLGVHDPTTNTLTLHAAPLHTFSSTIKTFKNVASTAPSVSSQIAAQRALLGTTFGTKKAQRNINTQARNKLDATSFGTEAGLQSALQNAIASSSTGLPTKEAIERTANEKRPIPPFNMEATSADQVYDFDAVVSPAELSALDDTLQSIIAAANQKERNSFIPFRRSDYIASWMRNLLPSRGPDDEHVAPPLKSKDRQRLQLLIHLSYLFAFRAFARPDLSTVDQAKLFEKMGSPSNPLVVDALLERYTEVQKSGGAGVERRRVTKGMEIKLLSYMMVVMLKIDKWNTDVTTVAKDLGMGVKKINEIFRSLGCSLVSPTQEERAKLVAQGKATTPSEARKCLKASLKVPLTFPVERRGAPKR